MTGREFMELSDARRRAFLEGEGGRCFSRAEPRHKLEIVRLLKDMGEVRKGLVAVLLLSNPLLLRAWSRSVSCNTGGRPRCYTRWLQ